LSFTINPFYGFMGFDLVVWGILAVLLNFSRWIKDIDA
jgi:hypothetical protein